MTKIKCLNCGTRYTGLTCPDCATPAPERTGKKKKAWVLPLVIVLVTVLAVACAGGTDEDVKQPASVQGDGSVTGTATEAQSGSKTDTAATKEPVTLAETLLYDTDGITVTATGLSNGILGPSITLTASNSTGKNIVITAQSLSVNGYMISGASLYCDVAAGKKANSEIYLSSSALEQAGIETIATVEFYLHITDSDAYQSIADSELLCLETSAAGTFTQPIDDSGDLVYDANGIRVICKGLKQDLVWDGTVVFYMENNASQPVTVYAENVSVNDYMVDVSLWTDLRAETRTVDGMYLLSLEELGLESIDDVSSIEFNLRIVHSDTWKELDTTDVITLSFS